MIALFLIAQWQDQGVTDGCKVETRKVANSAMHAIRVSAESPTPPALTYDAIWGVPGPEGVANKDAVKVHEVLLDKPTERYYYEVVSAPMISDRDYVIHLTRRQDGDVFEIKFVTEKHPAKPPVDGKIRMTIDGSAVIEPNGNGGSIITYEIFTDIGGAVPSWIVNGAQKSSSVEWMQTMIGRAKKRAAQAK